MRESRQPVNPDLLEGEALWCAVEIDAAGSVVLRRSASCSAADAADLCRLVAVGDAVVMDRSECGR